LCRITARISSSAFIALFGFTLQLQHLFSMRKIPLLALYLLALLSASAQKKDLRKNMRKHAADHIMLQVSADTWLNMPDSVKRYKSGFSRGFNAAFMINRPFKNNPKLSLAFGLGVSNSNIFFQKLDVQLNSLQTVLPFNRLDSSNYFKKYKVATTFLEVPLELRFSQRPHDEKKSFKVALGLKIGTLLNAHTKGKNLLDRSGKTINSYTEKINKRTFFSPTRLAATLRIGYGNFSVFGSYQLTNLFKDGAAAPMQPLQTGICISGL
jgi:hypothetical protein